MLDESGENLLQLFDEMSCTMISVQDFYVNDTILYLDLTIDSERFENAYWGREYNEGYQYKTYKL